MTMKKNLLFLIVLLTVNTTFADSYSKEEKTTNFVITPSVSYRYDVFKWAIPDNIFTNKKLSELTWKNYIVQPSIKIETESQPNQFTISGQVKYGYILKNPSESWDRDWHIHQQKSGNLKSTPDSKTLSSIKGNILDLFGAIGYSFDLPKNNLLTFYVGYDYMDYRNKQYGGRQLVNNQDILVIPFDKLLSKYNFKTQSPWVGLSVNVSLNDKFSIIPTIKLYSFKYVGKGYWLLRDDLAQNPSFKHTAKGQGLGFDVDFIYKFNDNLDFNINLGIKRFKMRKGQYHMFFVADPILNLPTRVSTNKLFDLNLISSAISGGIRYKF
jgi:hypothetical protein